jgi:hypothetical protein
MSKICDKCGNEILLDKWCSYDCLKEKAEKEGRSIEDLLVEMMIVTEELQNETDQTKNEGGDMPSM